MTKTTDVSQSVIDLHGLNQLKAKAAKDNDNTQTLRQVAAQFESLFVSMMLKSMRQAGLSEGIFDSPQSKMYQDMADQQVAADLSNGGGLGMQKVIMQQLGGSNGSQAPLAIGQSYSIDSVVIRPEQAIQVNKQLIERIKQIHVSPEDKSKTSTDKSTIASPEKFVETLWPFAKKAADKLGVTPEVLLSQAALETGWGRHVLTDSQGQTSFNLFNIKAHSNWQGESVKKSALEYLDGRAVHQASHFRSYDSYQQSFDDYVEFLQENPRYNKALQSVGDADAFIEQLHEAGFATDPHYADKIKRIMNSDTMAQISLDHAYLW